MLRRDRRSRQLTVPLPSAARATGVARLTDSNPHPLCLYDHTPYGRTSSPPMGVRPRRRS